MKIRSADSSDFLDILSWRNDPLSRKMFRNDNEVTPEEHEKWLGCILKNPLIKIYIGIAGEEKIGICRFDANEPITSVEISINLNPKMRGRNLSYDFLAKCIKEYKKSHETKLTATVRKINQPSLKIFERKGFNMVREDDKFYYLAAD